MLGALVSADIKLPDSMKRVEALFVDLRIDVVRVGRIVEQGGDMTGVPIDLRPEDAELGENAAVDGHLATTTIVLDHLGWESVDVMNPDERERFEKAENDLRAHDLLPDGLLGF